MIFNNDNKRAKAPVTPTARPFSDLRKREISDRLKIVDKLIKDGNLDKAKVELDTVRTMDPKNGYIFALEERIEELRMARDNPQSAELTKTGDESSPRNEIEHRVETDYLKKLTEEVHKIEERLEAEYHDRFMEEASKGEQRVAEILKQERERHDAETAALIVNFDKEKEKLLKEVRKEAKKLFDVEFKKVDDSYRKLLADEIRKTEEKARVETSALYEKAIFELKETVTKEKGQLSDVERKALIEKTKKQAEDELQKRFMEELAKVKTALSSSKEENEEEERVRLQTGEEKKSEADLKQIEGQIEARLSELDKASEERFRKSIQEAREALDKRVLEVSQDNPKSKTENERKLDKMQKEPGTDLGIKPEEQLTREREFLEKLREMEFRNIRDSVNWKDRSRKKKG